MPWADVASIGIEIADAVGYAHGCGFLHRDLKPENTLVASNGALAVADWGLGAFVHRYSRVLQLTRGGLGTEFYCSMEQWNYGTCGPTADIYSLGMTMSELVCGTRLPVTVGFGIHVDVVNERSLGAWAFNQLIRRMTSLLPRDRPQSMTQVAADLETALSAKSVH